MPEPLRVRAMFASIARRYDLLNRVLSVGIDRRWRRRLVERLGDLKGAVAVDACCGTGDSSLELAAAGARVVGVDFTWEMLRRARSKAGRGAFVYVQGDALRLPLADSCADVATVAFGIRNVADRSRGFAELVRVVRPGGRVCVLEFSLPRSPIVASLYRVYFTRMLPKVGGWISGDPEAYRYLPETVLQWPSPERLREEMQEAGLVECGFELLTAGIACLSWGRVGDR